jgi:hypothetical protein
MRIIGLLLLFVTLPVAAQNLSGTELYHKYSGTEGIVSLVIPGFIVRWGASLSDMEPEMREFVRNIGTVRILAVEDESLNKNLNFFNEVENHYDKSTYSELMVVREKDSDTRILVDENDGIIRELIIITGGEDNAFISIKGKFTEDDLAFVSKSMREKKSRATR